MWLAPYAVGAVAGTACDQIHLRCGVLSYAEPALFGQGWWVPFVFGLAGLAVVHAPLALGRALLPPPASVAPSPEERRAVALAAVWFVAAYAATGLFHKQPLALALGLVALWGARVASRRPSGAELTFEALLAIGGALGGVIVESTLSAAGLFQYGRQDLWRTPTWLPGLYLHGALLGRPITRAWYDGR
jgi:hypothetical protein